MAEHRGTDFKGSQRERANSFFQDQPQFRGVRFMNMQMLFYRNCLPFKNGGKTMAEQPKSAKQER